MSKKKYLLIAFIATSLGGLGVVWGFLPAKGVTKANHDRIEKGMTTDEVNLILGTVDFQIDRACKDSEWYEWVGRDGDCYVQFDESMRVKQRQWSENPRSITEKLWDLSPFRKKNVREPRLIMRPAYVTSSDPIN